MCFLTAKPRRATYCLIHYNIKKCKFQHVIAFFYCLNRKNMVYLCKNISSRERERKDIEMAKLYFKYGAMGSSKTANALITKFNYEERGMKVWLIKPSIDDRNGVGKVHSRIGIEAEAFVVAPDTDLVAEFEARKDTHAVIADECQFFTSEQIDQLRYIVDEYDVPVLCFGLRTDFLTRLFEGSKRLFEVADSINEVKTICACGKKAIVNARIDGEGKVLTEGGQILIGGNDSYVAMCHSCWKRAAGKK